MCVYAILAFYGKFIAYNAERCCTPSNSYFHAISCVFWKEEEWAHKMKLKTVINIV